MLARAMFVAAILMHEPVQKVKPVWNERVQVEAKCHLHRPHFVLFMTIVDQDPTTRALGMEDTYIHKKLQTA